MFDVSSMRSICFAVICFVLFDVSGKYIDWYLFLADPDDLSTKRRSADMGEGRITPAGKIICSSHQWFSWEIRKRLHL
jgi:hypothetical protein